MLMLTALEQSDCPAVIVGEAQGYNYGVSLQFMVILGSIDEDITLNAFTKTSCDTFLEYETLTTVIFVFIISRQN